MQDKKELDVITIGDKVEVNYHDSFNLIRYRKFNGHQAVVMNISEVTPYGYYLRFINEDVNNEYIEDSGGVEFKREWLVKLDITADEKKVFIEKYSNEKKMNVNIAHIKPKIQNIQLLNLSKVCDYLEDNGRKGIRDRMFLYLKDKINESNMFKLKLKHTSDELRKEDDITSDIILDLEQIKKEWNIELDYVYVIV